MQAKDLKDYLEDLAKKTADGQIVWERVNSTIYKWAQYVGDDNYSTTIQKASAPISVNGVRRIVHSYLLQINTRARAEPVVTISSKERPDYKDALASVFTSAEASTDTAAKSILSKLLGG